MNRKERKKSRGGWREEKRKDGINGKEGGRVRYEVVREEWVLKGKRIGVVEGR